ncbi:DUF4190 domain-containing protein [Bacillus lacus]|uniref:DUF4190 domain-containing protein n=1 Tax=Metabacillus lacus TaxID=1983721 RepID=A0A7X2IWN4_9BACI|nr:DUF4190 domain-containing protein [Metabacillus lacus]MRX71191.1 DUF4190 domain-containing protein [Metabacillus lacus]
MADKAGLNSKAITALTLGILSIFIPGLGLPIGIIGIIFSRLANKELKLGNGDGRGLAAAGLGCSIAGVVIHLFLIIVGILSFYSYS